MVRWILLFVVAAFAGCAGEVPDNAAVPVQDSPFEPLAHNITFTDEARFLAGNITGTFQPTDAPPVQALLGRAGQAPTNTQVTEVTEYFAPGAATWASVRVVAPSDGSVQVWLSSDDPEAIRTSDCDGCTFGAGTRWEGAVVRDASSLYVNAWYAGAEAQPVDFTIQIMTASTPLWMPSGVTLGLNIRDSDTTVRFQPAGGAVPDIMVFGPDDSYEGLLPGGTATSWSPRHNASLGEYVFHPVGHGQLFSLFVDAPEAPKARILGQDLRSEGPHEVTQNTMMTFDIERKPLQMGLAYFGFASVDAQATLEAPNGDTLELGRLGLGVGGTGGYVQTVMGDPALDAGTYTLTWSDTANDGTMQVQEFITLYRR